MSALPDEGELLMGSRAIAGYLGLTHRQVLRLIEKRAIPTWREGRSVVATRASLRAWIAAREAGDRA